MAADQDKLPQSLRKLGKSLKRVLHSSSPENIHQLRTRSRSLEAVLHALQLENKPRARRLLKTVVSLRRKAGKVRDMDVLIGFASKLATPGQNDALVQLLDCLGTRRKKAARKLHASLARRIKVARRQLKQCRPLLQANGADFAEQQAKATSAASHLSAELASWPRLTRANLHPYRLKVKELRYTLLAIEDSDTELIDSLGEVTNAIGEWHDWSELLAIATGLLKNRQPSGILHTIRSTVSAKLHHALSLAKTLRKQDRSSIARSSARHR